MRAIYPQISLMLFALLALGSGAAKLIAVEQKGQPGESLAHPSTSPAANGQGNPYPGNPRYTPVVDLVRRVRHAVVNIHSERTVRGPSAEELFALAPSQNRINGMGTGIVIDPRGYIITNHHVIEDVSVLRVRLADGTNHPARVLARDAESDLALLKIDANRPLPVMPLGTAQDLMVGETVVAIGNAYGYDHTVTVGVVSAIKRDVTLNKEISYKSLIQTDASINPGNSGGPLVNIKGELVGVNVAIRAGAQNIGFAIPVDAMMRVAADLISIRRHQNLLHGVRCRDGLDLQAEQGTHTRELLVEGVEPNSPAARAGIKAGDVLARVADQDVVCRLDMERSLLERSAGETVPVEIRRRGLTQKVELTLEGINRTGPNAIDLVWRKFGVRLQRANGDLVARSNHQLHGGMVISELRREGAAARAGLQQGDILVGLHQWEMLTMENVVFVLNHPDLPTFTPLRFYIIREGKVHRGWLSSID